MNDLDDLYAAALKKEGIDARAQGLLDVLRILHRQTLTPALVLRAYHTWRTNKEKISTMPAVGSARVGDGGQNNG